MNGVAFEIRVDNRIITIGQCISRVNVEKVIPIIPPCLFYE